MTLIIPERPNIFTAYSTVHTTHDEDKFNIFNFNSNV